MTISEARTGMCVSERERERIHCEYVCVCQEIGVGSCNKTPGARGRQRWIQENWVIRSPQEYQLQKRLDILILQADKTKAEVFTFTLLLLLRFAYRYIWCKTKSISS